MRRFADATERNREPILAVLTEVLPPSGLVLEVASGTGQHAVHFAAALPGVRWQPTDPDPAALASIEAWRQHSGLANLRAPVRLDTTAPTWPIERADAIVCINMIHISPWAACVGLFDGASRVLDRPRAPLVTYGPYMVDGGHTAPSNAAFDQSLRARDPQWGVRDVAEVRKVAEAHGFSFEAMFDMPANNKTLVFRRGD